MYLLPIVVTPILTRLYSPSDFGEWGIFSGFVTIVSVGMFFCLENAIMKSETSKVMTATSLLCLLSGISVTCIIVLALSAGAFLELSFASNFPSIPLLACYLLLYTLYTILFNIYNREGKYTTLSFCNVVQGISQAVFRLLFALFSVLCVNGLIMGTVVSQLCSVTFLLFFVKRYVNFESVSFPLLAKTITENKKFIIFDTPSSILSFAAFNLPILILSFFFLKEEIGCYSIILQLLLVPMSFFGSSMSKVYYQQLCSVGCQDNSLTDITDKVLRITTVVSILPLAFLALGGDAIVVMFLSEKWMTAGNIALCLSIWSFPILLTQPLLPLFRYLDKMSIMFKYESLYFFISIASLLCCCFFSGNLILILSMYSISALIVKMFLLRCILKEAHLSLLKYKHAICLWIVFIAFLFFRLINLLDEY